jgi:hypothetical protein
MIGESFRGDLIDVNVTITPPPCNRKSSEKEKKERGVNL